MDWSSWDEKTHWNIRAIGLNLTWLMDKQRFYLAGTWVFHQERTPNSTVYKFKAQHCVRGELQEVDFNTYSPVFACSTVKLFLVLSLTLDWYTCSVEFSNAFVQATLDEPVCIHLPCGWVQFILPRSNLPSPLPQYLWSFNLPQGLVWSPLCILDYQGWFQTETCGQVPTLWKTCCWWHGNCHKKCKRSRYANWKTFKGRIWINFLWTSFSEFFGTKFVKDPVEKP